MRPGYVIRGRPTGFTSLLSSFVLLVQPLLQRREVFDRAPRRSGVRGLGLQVRPARVYSGHASILLNFAPLLSIVERATVERPIVAGLAHNAR